MKPVYSAPTEAAALERFCEFRGNGGRNILRSCGFGRTRGAEFVPFLAFDTEIRRVVCSTNAIESVNARIRRAVRARGHFPTSRPH
ncbi:transposase [Nocardia nova]|uniref:transposase n=1 Tax=Nocardia nova TaxID=37330 RepID=UPI001471CEC2